MTQTTKTEADARFEVLSNPMAVIKVARKGIPRKKIDVLAKPIGLTDREMARILQMSERTLHRYKDDTLLDMNASERLIQLAILYRKGEETFGNLEKFKRYMRRPLRIFEGKAPLELLDSSAGFKLIESELERIAYGVFI